MTSNDKLLLLNVLSTRTRRYPSMHRTECEFDLKFSINSNVKDVNLLDLEIAFKENLDELIYSYLENISEDSLVGFYINNSVLFNEVFIPAKPRKDFNTNEIYKKIFEVAQSYRDFSLDSVFKLIIFSTLRSQGGGRSKKIPGAPLTLAQVSQRKRSVVQIPQTFENSCAFRAFFVSKYYLDEKIINKNLDASYWQRVRKDKLKIQTIGAKLIANNSTLDFNSMVGISEWSFIQMAYPDYQILVFEYPFKNRLFFKGPNMPKKIFIEKQGEHYNAIVNICGFLGFSYFCFNCLVPYDHRERHKCPDACSKCLTLDCLEQYFNLVSCPKCRREFYGQKCFELHSKICNSLVSCLDCGIEYKTCERSHHSCGELKYCKFCNTITPQPHFCYTLGLNEDKLIKEDVINKIIVSYDIESIISNTYHEPNLLIFKTFCDECYDKNIFQCSKCFINTDNVLFGKDCIKNFVDYLFFDLARLAEKNNSIIYAFAHNARAYDAQFILREVWSRKFKDSKIILNGRKILKLSLSNVNLMDSLNFFQSALDKLPKAFGIKISNQYLDKDWFPHFFNIEENYNYSGPIPDLDLFNPKHLTEEKRQKLILYHEAFKASDKVWNFKEQLISYCQKDVDILSKCIFEFRNKVKKITNIDPITRQFTLAGLGLEIFRVKVLKNKYEIAQTPKKPYSSPPKNTSFSSQAWLDFIQKRDNIELYREYKYRNYFFDGFDFKNKKVFEYLGCYHHGHGCNPRTVNQERLDDWEKKKLIIESKFSLEFIWHCQMKEIQKNDEYKAYIQSRIKYYRKMITSKKGFLPEIGWADLRESFFGGRVNNLFFKFSVLGTNNSIRYKDVTSEYPFVLKYRKFPIGHPISIREDFGPIENYFGFIKCRILPPKDLYLPVLPYRIKRDGVEKLVFPLCLTCSQTKSKVCSCSIQERSMVNTWTTEEIKVALQKGYKILETFEILHYNEDQVSDEVFREYIDLFLRIKQQASGWPEYVENEVDLIRKEELKQEYIQKYKEKENIQLIYSEIEYNEALRSIAKLFLNSLWGKFAQQPNQSKHLITSSYQEYYETNENPKYEIKDDFMLDLSTVRLSFKYVDDEEDIYTKNNIAVASYVTAWARLYLYSIMEKVESIHPFSLLYFDTDSVMYVNYEGDEDLETGDYLGDLTDELKAHHKISRFMSLGPKNYGYEVMGPDERISDTVLKCKGISLTFGAKKVLTFDKMEELIKYFTESDEIKELKVPQQRFRIDKTFRVLSEEIEKKYRITSDKRMVLPPGSYKNNSNYITLPWGFQWNE